MAIAINSFVQIVPVMFSGFFGRMTDALPSLQGFFYISYLRYALEGTVDATYGYGRKKLQCNELYCHFQVPSKFIRDMDMQRNDFFSAFLILIIYLICLRAIAFAVVAWRIKQK